MSEHTALLHNSFQVHFDVMYRGVDVVSSRQARLLGGNRTIAEPYEFVVGEAVDAQPVKKISDSAGGLFSGQGGPKPPPALSTACLGMKKGGKVSIKHTSSPTLLSPPATHDTLTHINIPTHTTPHSARS
jgi:hypothetical protein